MRPLSAPDSIELLRFPRLRKGLSMAIEDAKKVLAYAMVHPSFRAGMRSNPQGAISASLASIGITKPPSVEELDLLVSLTDADYDSLKRLAEGLGDSFSGEH